MDLSKLAQDADVEKATDSSGKYTMDANLYPLEIKTVFMAKSASGALGATIIGTIGGDEFTRTEYVSSGDAKGNKTYFMRGDTKVPMMGYTVIDDLCKLTVGKKLSEMEMEETTIQLMDKELQKKVPTEVECLVDMEGQCVYIAMAEIEENKTEKNDEGKYVSTNEKRLTNNIDKMLDATSQMTASEMEDDDVTTGMWAKNWLDKNEGVIRSKFKAVDGASVGTTGAPKAVKKKMFAGT